MKSLSPTELAQWLGDTQREKPFLLDVREAWEFEIGHIEGSQLIPMNSIPEKINELDKTRSIVCICHHGMRSYQVAYFLEQNGFTQMINLTGGVDAWSHEVDSSLPTY